MHDLREVVPSVKSIQPQLLKVTGYEPSSVRPLSTHLLLHTRLLQGQSLLNLKNKSSKVDVGEPAMNAAVATGTNLAFRHSGNISLDGTGGHMGVDRVDTCERG